MLTKIVVAAFLVLACATGATAAEFEVKMLNKGVKGAMVFEPDSSIVAPGDSVHFVATDKSHDVMSIDGMIPEGASAFEGKVNEDLTVTFTVPGVYGYKCKPHYGMGMIGLGRRRRPRQPRNRCQSKTPRPGEEAVRRTLCWILMLAGGPGFEPRILGVRVRCSTVELSPNGARDTYSLRAGFSMRIEPRRRRLRTRLPVRRCPRLPRWPRPPRRRFRPRPACSHIWPSTARERR